MKLNDKIVTVTSSVVIDRYKVEKIELGLIGFLSLIISVPSTWGGIVSTSEGATTLLGCISCVSILLTVGGLGAFFDSPRKVKFKEYFYYTLHVFNFWNKKNRKKEIDSFINQYKPLELKSTLLMDGEVFSEQLTAETVESWLKKYVSDTDAIFKLCLERSIFSNNTVNMNFLYWTQMIPFVSNINTNRTMVRAACISSIKQLDCVEFISRSDINDAFSLYSDSDLIRFFTAPIDAGQYGKALNFFLKNKIPLPIQTSMYDLFLYIQEQSLTGKFYFPEGRIKEGRYFNMDLKQIKNIVELQNIHNYMYQSEGCVQWKAESYLSGNTYSYILMKNNRPFLLFEYKNNKVENIMKRNHREVYESEKYEIDLIIKENLS